MRRSAVVLALVALAALVPAGGAGAGTGVGQPNPCVGTMTSPANGTTVISVQGARLSGEERGKRAARIVAVGPRGRIRWVHPNGPRYGVVWSYDVDPLPGRHLFVTATKRKETVFYVLNVTTQERVWTETLPLVDTHDADLLDDGRILIANMRNYDESSGTNRDRILIYNRTADAVEWEWTFRERYPRNAGGNYTDDWTHVNDVDRIAPGRYLVSVRNFDQVIVVDRETGAITLRLGADDRTRVLHEQHNPQYLESEAGRPTILVADSGNDRIVEYEKRGGKWVQTWRLGGSEVFTWPRDADRLPNGNTLIVDSRNHRVIEVTPGGEVVWEVYAPWLVYDAERVRWGDEAGGPTIRDQGAAGAYNLTSGEPRALSNLSACDEALSTFENPETVTSPAGERHGGGRADGETPDGATTTTRTPGQPGFALATAAAALLAVALAIRSHND